MEIINVNESNFESEVMNSTVPVLVDFNANWCGPCRMLRPLLETVASVNENVKIVSINVDENETLSRKYGVMSIPCLVLIKNGVETKRSVGLINKNEIENFIGEKDV